LFTPLPTFALLTFALLAFTLLAFTLLAFALLTFTLLAFSLTQTSPRLRFASQVGCLAITYVKTPCYVDSGGGGRNITLDNVLKGENRYDAEIASVLVKPSRRSVLGWEIEGVYYDGLGSLICAIEELKWLYPHHAKGATFSYTGGRREGGIGGALQGR